jgi:hypothetical protein
MKIDSESYSTSFDVNGTTKNVTYRLFYIDFNNDYKDGEGTIYLKADCVESTALITSEEYNEANVQKFNIGYTTTNTNRGEY